MEQAVDTLSLYDEDFYSWSLRQADLLRAGRLQEIDVENLIEELESSGRSQVSALQSSLRIILLHLLKLRYQPGRATRRWRHSIARERINAEQTIDENPGLKPQLGPLFLKAYGQARRLAATETGLGLSVFPVEPEFDVGQALSDSFLPDRAVPERR